MTDLILPRAPRNALQEFLRTRDGQDFANTVQLSDRLSREVSAWAKKNKMRNAAVLKALLGSITSCVQAMAPEEEWEDVAAILAEELRGRLTVRQVG
jgi:hypothetical protein